MDKPNKIVNRGPKNIGQISYKTNQKNEIVG